MFVMLIIMALPVLGLGLFYFLRFQVALPIYLFLLLISGVMYYGMFTVMGKKRKVRTGFEEMMGKEGLVFEDISPEGKVRIDNELWTARAQGGRFVKGEKVRICGHEGLTLLVEALNEKEKRI
jgi:membrane protein implicated in regulation of membrane protease activity